jgi:hypothetical protein
MEKNSKIVVFTLTLLVAAVLQVILVFADCAESPNKIAVQFSKAYFSIDPSMSQYLCNELRENQENDVVDQFIHKTSVEARNRGVGLSYLKSKIYHIQTYTLSKDEGHARIRIAFKRRTSINPVYTIVAKIFALGATYEVEEEIDLIKEDGHWKVCGKLYTLT